jgi:hypothetical protein
LIKRYDSTAKTYKEKGDREWAYAKNGQGGEHYGYAKQAYDKAKDFKSRADSLRKGK